jgi:hypothetical protein
VRGGHIFQVNAEQLGVLDVAGKETRKQAPVRSLLLGSVFVNGFWMTAFLQCRASRTTPGGVTLGCFFDDTKTTKAVPCPRTSTLQWPFPARCRQRSGAQATPSSQISKDGYDDILRASAASVTAPGERPA